MTRPAAIIIAILLFGLLAVIFSTSLGEMVLTPMEVIRGALGIGKRIIRWSLDICGFHVLW